MPFAYIGGNPEQDYFSHGITADIHNNLTRFHNLFVSGRSSCLTVSDQTTDVAEIAKRLGVKYLVKGSVRSDKGRLLVTAELLDGETGGILWSERYDRVLHDIFDVETEVANTIAATLSIRIEDALYERRKDCSDKQLSAYDWILRGNRNLELGGAENWSNAKREFNQALEIDPESSTAYAGLSIAYGYECGELLAANFAESLDRHHELAKKAIELDGSDSRGHYAMSCAHQFFEQWELADRHAERAVELNPSEYHNICARGYTLMCLGRFEESAATFNESLRRNPLAPNSCLLALGNIEYQEENFGQSAITLSSMTPSYVQRVSTLAAAYAQLGYKEAARSASQEFRNLVEMRPGCPPAGDSESWRRFWRIIGASSSLSSRSSGSDNSLATSSRFNSPPIFSASINEVSRSFSKCRLSNRLNSPSVSTDTWSTIPSRRWASAIAFNEVPLRVAKLTSPVLSEVVAMTP